MLPLFWQHRLFLRKKCSLNTFQAAFTLFHSRRTRNTHITWNCLVPFLQNRLILTRFFHIRQTRIDFIQQFLIPLFYRTNQVRPTAYRQFLRNKFHILIFKRLATHVVLQHSRICHHLSLIAHQRTQCTKKPNHESPIEIASLGNVQANLFEHLQN